MTDQTASLAELEIRSALSAAMDGNLRQSRRRELLDAYRDAVLAAVSAPVQPPTTRWDFCAPTVTRADVLKEAADVVAAMNEGCGRRKPCTSCDTREDVAAELRRMAGEEQPAGPDACSGCRYVPCGNCAAGEEQPATEARDVASLQQDVKRLGLMVDEYGAGASALTDKLKRVRDRHRETCPFARSEIPPGAFKCGMCELLDAAATKAPR